MQQSFALSKQLPSSDTYEEPRETEGHTVVKVLAAPLSPIVKSLAAGKHYTAAKTLADQGFVPGIDGVGLNTHGERVYFMAVILEGAA